MDALQTRDVWKKKVYDATGRYLGSVEAVSLGGDRTPRRIGVRGNRGGGIKFFLLRGAQAEGEWVVLAARDASDLPLRVVPGGSG